MDERMRLGFSAFSFLSRKRNSCAFEPKSLTARTAADANKTKRAVRARRALWLAWLLIDECPIRFRRRFRHALFGRGRIPRTGQSQTVCRCIRSSEFGHF